MWGTHLKVMCVLCMASTCPSPLFRPNAVPTTPPFCTQYPLMCVVCCLLFLLHASRADPPLWAARSLTDAAIPSQHSRCREFIVASVISHGDASRALSLLLSVDGGLYNLRESVAVCLPLPRGQDIPYIADEVPCLGPAGALMFL